ncbi:hypothetical protein PInf_024402 [Phytophthora infestans]|nr:hypothetical protein PInf_024402 [Phytophthora infestans]
MVGSDRQEADEQLLADREMAYRVIQHVSGFRRDDLQRNVRKYTTTSARDRQVAYIGDDLFDGARLSRTLDYLAIDGADKYLEYAKDEGDFTYGEDTGVYNEDPRSFYEEEEKASSLGADCTSKSVESSRGEKDEDNVNTSGADDFAYNRSVSSDVDAAPVVDSTLAQSQISKFLNRGQASDDECNDSQKSRRFHERFVAGKSSVRLALLATLDQVTRTVQRRDLSEASMIAREDMNNKMINTNEDSDDCRARSGARMAMLRAFDAAQDLGETLAAFSNLLNDCGLNGVKVDEPWHVFFHIKAAVYSKLSFRHKQLFKLLDARFNLDVYTRKHAARKRVCIVGAGPVGLRAAVETALLGGQVIVLEKREHFSRENMLHLWPWVIQDLVSLGAKVFFPQFGKSNSHFYVSMRQLQVILLKVALLLGVTIYPATDFESIVPPGLEESGGEPFYSVVTQPQIPTMEFTAVLGAAGTNDKLAKPAGINRFVYSDKEALGIVCYFPNFGTSDEVKAKEFSWTTQQKHPMLDKLRDIGLDLENIVYYRGEMHYLVMTPKRQNLRELHVVNEDRPSSTDLVMDDNINNSALYEFVKGIVDFAGIPRKTDFTRVSLFDFSSLTRADKAASILSSHGKKLYVGLIGDSLHEPVWHDGVGTCSGFLSALDSVWMVAQIGRDPDEQLLVDREAAYQVTMRVSNNHREDLQKNIRKYTADPRSRYTV